MIKRLTFLLLIVLAGCSSSRFSVHSKYISDKELNALDDALQKEDWSTAASLSSYYIKILKNDTTILLSQMNYIYLLSSAAKVSMDQMSYDALKETLKDYQGKLVTLPSCKVWPKQGACFNLYAPTDEENVVVSTATDRLGCYIFCWVYGNIESKFDASANSGRWAVLEGYIKSIEYNPRQSNWWILRVTLEPAHLMYE